MWSQPYGRNDKFAHAVNTCTGMCWSEEGTSKVPGSLLPMPYAYMVRIIGQWTVGGSGVRLDRWDFLTDVTEASFARDIVLIGPGYT